MNEPQTYVDLQDAGNAQAQLILQAIARHANWDTGQCWPGDDAISRMAKCSTRTVQTYLAKLENDGLISREDRRSERGTKQARLITLTGYAEWISALREGGQIRKPKTVGKYEQPPERLSGGPPENIAATTGKLPSVTTGKLVAGQEHSLNNQLTKDARAREDLKSGFKVKGGGFQITKTNNPDELAAWRRYALHRGGYSMRLMVRIIDTHGFAVVPSPMPPDVEISPTSKRLAGEAA